MRTTTTLIIAILAASFAAGSAWAAQTPGEGGKARPKLANELNFPIESVVRSVIPCDKEATPKCLAGIVTSEKGREPRFKLIGNSGTTIWERPASHFREGWVRGNDEVVLVDRDDQAKEFVARRFDAVGKELAKTRFSEGRRDSEEFDYNAAGNGELFAVNVDTVIYLDGRTAIRPAAWKKSVMTPLYWYLLPDASIVVSSGRSREGGKEETARIDINGGVMWRHPAVLMLPGHIERRAARMPKYLFAWGTDSRSLSLVQADNGETYWKIAESSDSFGINMVAISPS
ncbi:MAG: hypothetical protein WC943_04530, partial [Elusimicrobiota bacterium]